MCINFSLSVVIFSHVQKLLSVIVVEPGVSEKVEVVLL